MARDALIILINVSWQLILIFVMSWLILAVFRIRSASARRVIWLGVVLSPLALLPMNIISSDIVILRAGDFERNETINYNLNPAVFTAYQGGEQISTVAPVEEEILDSQPPLRPETQAVAGQRFSENVRIKFMLLLVIIWSSGIGVGFALVSVGYFRLKRLISKASQVKDEKVIGIFQQAVAEVGTSRRIRLLASNEAHVPFSIGFIHPYVVLPERMLDSRRKLTNFGKVRSNLPKLFQSLRMVLIHEIIHLKRFDDIINLVCQVIKSFMFFHPLLHLAVRELRLSNEESCDGWAIKLTGEKEDYANCLVELSRDCAGRLPIGFGESGGSMTIRVKSILQREEVHKMLSARDLVLVSVLVFSLILAISYVRLVNPVFGRAPSPISLIDKFQRCENGAEAGFFWVNTTNGETWWSDPGKARWAYGGRPEGAEPGEIGTYMPCPNRCGAGLFIIDTITGKAWWARGYEQEWMAIDLGRPDRTDKYSWTADVGDIGTYMPYEKYPEDMPFEHGGLYILNTRTGNGWWTPPSNEDNSPAVILDNPDAKEGEVGTYMLYRNKGGPGLFILNTASGKCWWTNGEKWERLDKGKAIGGEAGTYLPYDNRDGGGFLILSTKTGEGWWTNGDVWEFMGDPSKFPAQVRETSMESEEPKPEGENLITEKAYKLFKEKKFEDAIAAYQEIYDKHAEWRLRKNSLMMIGLCYDWMGNGEKAIQYLERSIQEYPDRKDYSPATYFYLGQMYAKADQREKALESYKECVQICEMKGMNPESFPLKNARIMLRRLEKPGEYLPPIFNEKLESQEKQEALRKIEQFYKEAKFHQGAIAEIAGLVPEAEHNVPVIVHAAYLASKFSYHTGPLIDIAKLASSCDHECPELYELADLDVMKKSESVRLMQIAESAVKAQSKEEKEKVRQQIEEFKATADYKSIEEALKGQQSR